MVAAGIILKLFTNKWTYIGLFVLTIIITCTVFVLRIKAYENKIQVLHDSIKQLETTNTVLHKDNLVKTEKLKILESFTNSTSAIEKITDKELSDEDKNAIDAISNDFYNYVNNNSYGLSNH